MVLLPFFTNSDVPNDDSITGLNIGSSKKKTPSRAVLCPRRRLNVRCAVECAGSVLWTMPTPVPSLNLLRRLEYRRGQSRCQEPGVIPLLVPGRPLSPWEDYNYKSLAAVAHTPGWNGTPVADDRELDLSRRLRIGCVFRARNVTFYRVLHTQLIESIDFVRFEAQNLFSFLARVGRGVLFTDF